MTAWSYSSIKTFDQCPKKYFHLKVSKDVNDNPGPEALYGTQVHQAAEDYIKLGTPIPPKFNIIKATVEALEKFPGDKRCELKLGVKKTDTGYEPCGFFDKEVWWRGIVDFIHNPEIKVIKSGLAYVVSNEFPKKTHYRENLDQYLSVFDPQLEELENAIENGIWNAKSGPLCGWCPVGDKCEHWKPRRR